MPAPFFGWGGTGDLDRRLSIMATQLGSIERKLDQVLKSVQRGREFLMSTAEELARLTSAVQANKDVVGSAAQAMSGLVQTVSDLTQKLQDAVTAAGPDVSPDIKAAADALQANTDTLAAAIPQLAAAVPPPT